MFQEIIITILATILMVVSYPRLCLWYERRQKAIANAPKGPGKPTVCWNNFCRMLVDLAGGEYSKDLERAVLKSKNLTSLARRILAMKADAEVAGNHELASSWESVLKTVIYYEYHGIADNRNHISNTYFEGSSSMILLDVITGKERNMGAARWWALFSTTDVAVSDALWTKVEAEVIDSGAPMEGTKLRAAREALWNSQKDSITIYQSSETKTVLPKSSVGMFTKIDNPNAGGLAPYFAGATKDNLDFYMAMTMNFISVGGPDKEGERFFFKAHGAKEGSNNVYYSFPGLMTSAAISFGVKEQFLTLTNKSKAKNSLKFYHKSALVMSELGVDIKAEVVLKNASGSTTSYHLGQLIFPNAENLNLSNEVVVKLRDDLDRIAKAMKAQKDSNKLVAKSERKKVTSMEFDKMVFFTKTGVKYTGV